MSRSALRLFCCVAIEYTFWTYLLVRQEPIRRFQRGDVTRLFHEAVARGGFHRTRNREQFTVEPFISQTFDQDVWECPSCHARTKLVALVTEPKSIVRYLTTLGEPIDAPARATSRGRPYWKSTVLRRKAGA